MSAQWLQAHGRSTTTNRAPSSTIQNAVRCGLPNMALATLPWHFYHHSGEPSCQAAATARSRVSMKVLQATFLSHWPCTRAVRAPGFHVQNIVRGRAPCVPHLTLPPKLFVDVPDFCRQAFSPSHCGVILQPLQRDSPLRTSAARTPRGSV